MAADVMMVYGVFEDGRTDPACLYKAALAPFSALAYSLPAFLPYASLLPHSLSSVLSFPLELGSVLRVFWPDLAQPLSLT